MADTETHDPDLDHWNYRLIRHLDDKVGETWIGVHEVYYRDDRLWSYTVDPVAVVGSDEAGCREQLQLMVLAFDKPTLTPGDFPDEGRQNVEQLR